MEGKPSSCGPSRGVTSLRLRARGRPPSDRMFVVHHRPCAASRRALGAERDPGCRPDRAAPVSHDAPCGASRAHHPWGEGGCVADLLATVHPAHCQSGCAGVQAKELSGPVRSRSYRHSDPPSETRQGRRTSTGAEDGIVAAALPTEALDPGALARGAGPAHSKPRDRAQLPHVGRWSSPPRIRHRERLRPLSTA
jgi:hypothetical protein